MRAKYDQHFLIEPDIARAAADALAPSPEDTVVEIGPGRGMLTRMLAARAGRLIAVEIDDALANRLRTEFAAASPGARTGEVKVIAGDFLDMDIDDFSHCGKLKIIGNLPYSVSTPILEKLFDSDAWTVAVVMLQKEFADRLLAPPGGKEYGRLSVFAQVFCEPSRVRIVPPECFRPQPRVTSEIVKLTRLARPLVPPRSRCRFFKTVAAAFCQRRKTIINSLSAGLKISREKAARVLKAAGIEQIRRAETVSIAEFAVLSDKLSAGPSGKRKNK